MLLLDSPSQGFIIGRYHPQSMGQIKVRDIMTTQVITVLETDTIRDATITLAVDTLSGAPVIDDDYHLCGIISEMDILNLIMKYEAELKIENPVLHMLAFPMDTKFDDPALESAAKKFSNTKVSEIMTKDVITTTPDAEVVDVLALMLEKDVNRVPVLEKGVLVGIVSRGDIVFSIYKRKI